MQFLKKLQNSYKRTIILTELSKIVPKMVQASKDSALTIVVKYQYFTTKIV